MEDALTMPTAEEVAHYQATILECFAEIDRLRELMRLDDIEIARSRAQIQETLAEISAMRTSPEKIAP